MITDRALIVVDVQNDFCEGGALAVPGGTDVALGVAELIRRYEQVVVTLDWHNPLPDTNGGHFDTWPVHCVAGTFGAELHPSIAAVIERHDNVTRVFKGQGRPAYSGFEGVTDPTYGGAAAAVRLAEHLASAGIGAVDVVGLAADYCVISTAVNGLLAGFGVEVLWGHTAAVRGVDGMRAAQAELDRMRLEVAR